VIKPAGAVCVMAGDVGITSTAAGSTKAALGQAARESCTEWNNTTRAKRYLRTIRDKEVEVNKGCNRPSRAPLAAHGSPDGPTGRFSEQPNSREMAAKAPEIQN